MMCFRYFRRNFVKSTVFNSNLSSDSPHKPRNDVQIVIIGAGLAGLSAASHLIKNGFKRTILLEASERLGGRVNTQHFGDTFCELGAKYISINASKDSLYEVLNNTTRIQKNVRKKDSLMYLNSNGESINNTFSEYVESFYRKLSTGIDLEKYKSGDMHDLNNVHTYFQAETRKIVNAVFKDQYKNIASDIFTSLFKEFGGLLGCCLEYVNIEHVTNLNTLNTSAIYIPNGLDNMLKHISENIDKDQLRVGKPVGQIKWYGISKLDQKSVGCMDGTLFPADHIICTLPLGVLKTFSKCIFRPMLPKEKINAITNLGFGCPVKIYFEYEHNIKTWFKMNIRPLWNEEERKENLHWTKQLVEVSKLPKSNRVLEITVGGEFYELIEKLPDTEVLIEITKLLRSFLKNPHIPYPVTLLRSNWNSLATFLGGRPYFSTITTLNDINTLAAPLGDTPSLLFAGDATILQGFGTVDGARRSGIREADRIINYYKKRV